MENTYIYTGNRACALLYKFLRRNISCKKYILPVNICPSVPLTFCLARQPFEFADINPETLCIDEEKCISSIQSHPDAYAGLLFVRTYGYIYDTEYFFKRAKKIINDFKIIDDRCLCIPDYQANLDEADMLLFSTGHCKQADLEMGGFAITKTKLNVREPEEIIYNNTDIETMCKEALSNSRPLPKVPSGWLRISVSEGITDKYMKEIRNAILEKVKIREHINRIYMENLPREIQCPLKFQDWRFNIQINEPKRSLILNKLFSQGLFASTHYKSCNVLFNIEGIFKTSNNLQNTVINLFNDKYYTEEKALRTCKTINDILKNGNNI